jgi:hypothetical protein
MQWNLNATRPTQELSGMHAAQGRQMPCSNVGGYQRFGSTCCFHLQDQCQWGDNVVRLYRHVAKKVTHSDQIQDTLAPTYSKIHEEYYYLLGYNAV